jgi:alpha-glucosidase
VTLLTLRGTPFLYAGEELGLENAVVTPERCQDMRGRDGPRAPIPWISEPPHGWASTTPWLPWPPDAVTRNPAVLHEDPDSILWLYRRAIHLRRTTPVLRHGDMTLLDAGEGLLMFRRFTRCGDPSIIVAMNFTDAPVRHGYHGRILLSSAKAAGAPDPFVVPPFTTVVISPQPE